MKATELRELTEAELAQKLNDARQELFNLRQQQASARLERPSRIRELRRDIARIRTVARRRASAKGTA